MKPRSPNSDKAIILTEATKLANKLGRNTITFAMIAKELNISRTVLYTHFNNVESLKKEILLNAINTNNIIILIEALIFNKISYSDIPLRTKYDILEFFK